MQSPAAFQIFGVPVQRQSRKHRSQSVIRQCDLGTREVYETFRNMLMTRGGTPQPRRAKPFRTVPGEHFLHWFEVRRTRRNMNSRLMKAWQWAKGLWQGPGPSSPYYIRATPNSKEIQFESIADLSEALTRAKDALGKFERTLGRPEANWPLWCAAHMAAEQGLLGRTRYGLVKGTGQVEPPPADPEEDYWSRH